MKLSVLGIAGLPLVLAAAALVIFSSADRGAERQTQTLPVADIQASLDDVPNSTLPLAMSEAIGSVRETNTFVAARAQETEYVLCAVWFLGKVSDQITGVNVADAGGSHTVPLPAPIWLMQKLRNATS